MFPKGTPDPEYPDDPLNSGTRNDGRNLVVEWLAKYKVRGVLGGRDTLVTEQPWAETHLCPLKLSAESVCVEPNGAAGGLPGPRCDSHHG